MKRHFRTSPLKFVLSVMLALALSVAPVSANDYGSRSDAQDATTVIGILLGLATIGALLSSQDEWKDRDDDTKRPTKRVYRDRVPKHLILPKDCVRAYRTQQGERTMFSNRCLKRTFKYYGNLPRTCKANVVARNTQGTYVTRKTFRPRCLHDHGYRLTRYY